ncbi:MAG: aminomethyltransferase family protein [Myxococcota bacterium]
MARTTPFHPRTAARCRSFLWKEWNGFAAVRAYDSHSEEEYFAIRHRVGLIDVSPLCKYDVSGPHAATLLSRVFSRDVEKLGERRVVYGVLVDPRGKVLDDGTCAHLEGGTFRLCTSERWAWWLERNARGLDVTIEDTTDRYAALALQGPRAREVLGPLLEVDGAGGARTGFDLGQMPFFRVRRLRIAGKLGWVARTGYTGDLGYELFVDAADALPVWDAVAESGTAHGLTPFGLDALDVARIEAGFILQGVDYFSSRAAMIEPRRSTPDEIGLGGTVDLERATPLLGQDQIVAERARGPAWDLVGVELDWTEIERLYHSYGLPPHLAPIACRSAVPVYAEDGRTQVGQVTSSTWSPLLKRYLALATVRRPYHELGTRLRVEHTVEFERRSVRATVVPRTFFDPDRKRSTTPRPTNPEVAR